MTGHGPVPVGGGEVVDIAHRVTATGRGRPLAVSYRTKMSATKRTLTYCGTLKSIVGPADGCDSIEGNHPTDGAGSSTGYRLGAAETIRQSICLDL